MDNIWILAQNAEQQPSGISSEPVTESGESVVLVADPNTGPAPVAPRKPTGYYNFVILGLMFVVMYFLIFRGPKKKQQQHQRMVKALEKNDRVKTIGGIIGTIVDIRDNEITLKIDESNNTKIKVVPSAIGGKIEK